MSAPALSASAVSYLFAREWAPVPQPRSSWTMSVPGGEVDGVTAAANLLNVAIWSLGDQGLAAVTQLRPVAAERTLTMGGRSFARVEATVDDTQLAGLEGRLLDAARDHRQPDLRGVRDLVLRLDLHTRHPWATVAEICLQELCDAGFARVERRRMVLDSRAFDANRGYDAELRTARAEYRRRESDLDDAVAADCAAAVRWAFSSD